MLNLSFIVSQPVLRVSPMANKAPCLSLAKTKHFASNLCGIALRIDRLLGIVHGSRLSRTETNQCLKTSE